MRQIVGITGIGDPFILKHLDTYYLYATSFKQEGGTIDGFYCWQSTDLKTWTQLGKAYEKNEKSFGVTDFWAPEVVYHNQTFIMHYSARNANGSLRIGVAVSNHPQGPFIDVFDKKPMFDFGYAAIDGHVFIDDHQAYFYYAKDCSENEIKDRHESHLYVVKLDDTLTSFKGEPKLILKPNQPWETITGDWRWNEGAYVYKKDDTYYMTYSSGFYASDTYAIGYATAQSPMGPFHKSNDNPILQSIKHEISGPGHNCIFSDHHGQLYIAYHIHTDSKNPSEDRQLVIDKLTIDQGKMHIG